MQLVSGFLGKLRLNQLRKKNKDHSIHQLGVLAHTLTDTHNVNQRTYDNNITLLKDNLKTVDEFTYAYLTQKLNKCKGDYPRARA